MNSIDNQYQNRAAGTGSQTANLSGGNTVDGRTARRGKGRSEGRITDRLFTIILVSVMLAGIGLLAYPSLADYWNSFHQSRAVMSYAEHVSDMNTEEYDKILEEARAYNKSLAEISLCCPGAVKKRYICLILHGQTQFLLTPGYVCCYGTIAAVETFCLLGKTLEYLPCGMALFS